MQIIILSLIIILLKNPDIKKRLNSTKEVLIWDVPKPYIT